MAVGWLWNGIEAVLQEHIVIGCCVSRDILLLSYERLGYALRRELLRRVLSAGWEWYNAGTLVNRRSSTSP